MNRLQFATLLSWAGETGLQYRKRLQKVVFFLQHAGCPLGCHYSLHHFGPYSRDVADICDEMVAAGLVEEFGETSYSYKLTSQTTALLQNTRENPIESFKDLGKRLIEEDLWHLELGSTILFYFQREPDWESAMRKACDFKHALIEDNRPALELAKSVNQ